MTGLWCLKSVEFPYFQQHCLTFLESWRLKFLNICDVHLTNNCGWLKLGAQKSESLSLAVYTKRVCLWGRGGGVHCWHRIYLSFCVVCKCPLILCWEGLNRGCLQRTKQRWKNINFLFIWDPKGKLLVGLQRLERWLEDPFQGKLGRLFYI